MRKCDQYFAVSGYKYAPEQFKAYRVVGFSNGNRNIPLYDKIELTSEEISECGMAMITGGRNASIAKLKKILRNRDCVESWITYGFRYVDHPTQFVYLRGPIARRGDLGSRLETYKRIVRQLSEQNWEHETFTSCELGANFKTENVQVHKEKINRYGLITLRVS